MMPGDTMRSHKQSTSRTGKEITDMNKYYLNIKYEDRETAKTAGAK